MTGRASRSVLPVALVEGVMLLHIVSRIKSGCGCFRRIARWLYYDTFHSAPVGCHGNCHGTYHGHGHGTCRVIAMADGNCHDTHHVYSPGTCRVNGMADGNAWTRRSNSWLVMPTHGKLHGMLSSLPWHSTTKYDNVHPWRQSNESELIYLANGGCACLFVAAGTPHYIAC